jgi:hypothetical protein
MKNLSKERMKTFYEKPIKRENINFPLKTYPKRELNLSIKNIFPKRKQNKS